jgi:hypothetical protein
VKRDIMWDGTKCVAPTPQLPRPERWVSRDKRDADAMVAWVNEWLLVRKAEHMNEMIAEEVGDQWKIDPDTGQAEIVYWTDEDKRIEAEQGNMEPLREANPKIAAYINPRKRRVGETKQVPPRHRLRLQWAVEDVFYIRELWKREYQGRWKRGESNKPTAEQIAANFWKVDVRSVKSKVRH